MSEKGQAAKDFLKAAIDKIVARAPELTPEQVAKLRPILAGARDDLLEEEFARSEEELRKRRERLHAGPGVYFITDGINRVKIGFSDDCVRRLRQLSTGNSAPLRLLHVIREPDPRRQAELETELHERFAAHRVRGEWFQLHDDLRFYIRSVCSEGCGS